MQEPATTTRERLWAPDGALCYFQGSRMEYAGIGLSRPKAMKGWFLRVMNSQGQWKRVWSCTRCDHNVKQKVSADMHSKCLSGVTCAKTQWGACEARRLKWSQRQRQRECVLFIGTQFSNLYTAVDTPAKGRVGVCE